MKNVFIALLLLLNTSLFAEDGLLYVVKPNGKVTQSVVDDVLEWRMPVRKIQITHAVLRYDTEDRSILWLELHMAEMVDPGDFYYFKAAEESQYQFYFRGSNYHTKGCKWALRFDELEKARKVLQTVKGSYKLKDKAVIDKTKSG